MDSVAIYAAAAAALDASLSVVYAAIRAQHPDLDWAGHDRRAARLAGQSYAAQGPDPKLAGMARRISPLPPLPASAIVRCASCKARIYWSDTQSQAPTPFDVTDDGHATRINHFTTCPSAAQHRRAGTTKRKAS